jgi:hypothetical protein
MQVRDIIELPSPSSRSRGVVKHRSDSLSSTPRRVMADLSSQRGGIIPVIHLEHETLYCFGLDRSVANVTDLAGQPDASDADILDTCIREFEEESFSVFGHVTREQLHDSPVIVTDRDVLVLWTVPDPEPIATYMDRLRQRVRGNPWFEVQGLIFLTVPQLKIMAANQDWRLNGYASPLSLAPGPKRFVAEMM